MKIITISQIVNGNILNKPSISHITQINTESKKVKYGDLFISNDIQDIKSAVNNGAFCIIFHKNIKNITSLDNEIAWIQVENINDAMIKLGRIILSNINIKSYYLNKICFEILLNLCPPKNNIKYLSNNIQNDLNIISKIQSNDIIISNDKIYLAKLDSFYKDIKNDQKHLVSNLIKHSIYQISFSHKNIFYDRLNISFLYLNSFLNVLEFVKANGDLVNNFDLAKTREITLLSPLFIDTNCKIVEFGKSNKFIIANKNISSSTIEITFIKKHYNFGKLLIIDQFIDIKDLKKQIKNTKHNVIYIIGYSKNYIEKHLIKNEDVCLTLFD